MRNNLNRVVLSITFVGAAVVAGTSSCSRGKYSVNSDLSPATAAGSGSSGSAANNAITNGAGGAGGSAGSGGGTSGASGGTSGGSTNTSSFQPQISSGSMTNQVLTLQGKNFLGAKSIAVTDFATGAAVGNLNVVTVSPDGLSLTAQPASTLAVLASAVYNLVISNASAAQSLAVPISFSGTFSGPITIGSSGVGGPPSSSGTALSPGVGAVFQYAGSTASVLDFGMLANGSHWLQAINPTNQSLEFPILINPNGGNVGIGTLQPLAPLHVETAFFYPGTISSNGTGVNGVGTAFTSTFAVNDLISVTNSGGATLTAKIIAIANDTVMTTEAALSATPLSNLMYSKVQNMNSSVGAIFNSGRVGIGTKTPASLLHIYNSRAVAADAQLSYYPYDLRIDNAGDTGLVFQTPNGQNAVISLATPLDGASSGVRLVSKGGTRTVNLFAVNGGTFGGRSSDQLVVGDSGASVNGALAVTGPTSVGGLAVIGGTLTVTGCIYQGGWWTNCSDRRIKTDIESYESKLAGLLNIQPRLFRFNGLAGSPASSRQHVGVIAQELEEVFPELVFESPMKLHPQDKVKTMIKQVNYQGISLVIVNALKEFYAEFVLAKTDIQKLKDENEALRRELFDLKGRLERLESFEKR